MIWLALLGTTLAADPAVGFGGHVGLSLSDTDDLPATGWTTSPRLGVWFSRRVGLELDLAISGARRRDGQGRVRTISPQLGLAIDPLTMGIRPLLTAHVGAATRSTRTEDGEREPLPVRALGSVGTGLVFPVAGALTARTDLRLVWTSAVGGPSVGFTWTAGFTTTFGISRDRDHDFVIDRLDACPTEPEDLDGFEDEDGCRDPDNDGDGVRDELDSCDDEPEDLDGVEDYDGCPEPE